MPNFEYTELPDPKRRYLCRHIFIDGHRCGSPALRGQHFCYYHRRFREQPPAASGRADRPAVFTIPAIDDPAAIQIALHQVLTRLACNEIDTKRAGLFLYGLQVASTNLALASATRKKFTKTGCPIHAWTSVRA